MYAVSIRLAALLSATAIGLLAGCSTAGTAPEAQSTAQAQAQAQAQPADDQQTLTGSRIPRKSTDRLLKQVGQSGAAEMERNRPPEPGPKVN